MPLFKGKQKTAVEDFCKSFYDSEIFNFTDDLRNQLVHGFKRQITELDHSFSLIGVDSFDHELAAIQMETFGLLCSLSAKHKVDIITRQFNFTESYLEEKNRLDIWETMNVYRKIIDDSLFTDKNGKLLDETTPQGRSKLTFWREVRAAIVDKYWEENITDPENPTEEEKRLFFSLMGALCRVGPDYKRADSIAVKLVTATLLKRLQCLDSLNQQAKLLLTSIVYGLFNGAEAYLKSVSLI